jgi:hypothetical protein
MFDSGSRKLVDWPVSGVFQRNIVFSTITTTIASFNGGNWTCSSLVSSADVDKDGTGNDNVRCTDPRFSSVSGKNFHLASGSPAIDSATGTGLPSGRTTSINNPVASLHGFPSYADNVPMTGSAWDLGMAEVPIAGLSASVTLSDPSPTGPGNVTVTLATSAQVVQVPLLTFVASDNLPHTILLSGSLPGTTFTGTFMVDGSVPDGVGTFVLPTGSLVDGGGNTGNTLVGASQTLIDKAPPSVPTNLRFGG